MSLHGQRERRGVLSKEQATGILPLLVVRVKRDGPHSTAVLMILGWWQKFVRGNRERRWKVRTCLLYTSPSPRDRTRSRMPSSA